MKKNHWSNADFFSKTNPVYAYTHKNWTSDVPLHSHEFYELNIVLSGSGTHTLGDSCIGVRPGDVFVIPPGVKHTYAADSSLDIYHILLKTSFLLRYFDDLNDLPGFKILFEIEPALRKTNSDRFVLRLHTEELSEVNIAIATIAKAQAEKQHGYQNLTTLHLICTLSMKMHARNHDIESESGTSTLTVMHTTEYIRNHLDQKLTVAHLAMLAAMSVASYNRAFKKLMHTTPAEYILDCRIQKAETLLAEKKLTKSEVALHCGFYDISHMNKYLQR